MRFRNWIVKSCAAVCLALLSIAAGAQSIVVTSPSSGDFLGTDNQLKFLISGASTQARVVVTTTFQADPTIVFQAEGRFDPDNNNKVSSNVTLSFDQSTPTGKYDIKVEYFSQGSVVQTVNISNVTIDVKAPRFKNVAPGNNAFVSKTVRIRADIEEPNMDQWKVQVNGKDIPNNVGTTNSVDVTWDASRQETDGAQSITITVTDKARNQSVRSISVTLDRVAPVITIISPSTISYRPGATIPVAIDIADQAGNSVLNAGVQVTLRTFDGQLIQRVARRSARNNDKVLNWTGRIRAPGKLPRSFKLIVTAVDRAGNRAQDQEVIVTIGG